MPKPVDFELHTGGTSEVHAIISTPSLLGNLHSDGTSSVHATISTLIGWGEVDRLLSKNEYAAAVLVAVINVEFSLKEHLSKFAERSKNKQVRKKCKKIRKSGTLGYCFQLAMKFSKHHGFSLNGCWQTQVELLKEPRDKIAHTREYFERFTKLEVMDEASVMDLITAAREFCGANPVTI